MSDLPIKWSPSDHNELFHASNHGGPVIGRVSLQLIFWGAAWPNPPSGPNAAQITAAAQKIVTGPYLSSLLQYGAYLGSLRGTTFVNSDPPNPFSKDDWHNKIWEMIDDGTFPEPDDAGGLNLYMFIPPWKTMFSDMSIGGSHGSPWDYDPPWDVDYVYAGFALNTNDLDTVTNNLSHEIVEACTDPEGQHDDGWTLDGRSHPESEICDVCENTKAVVDGVALQGYWSNFDNGCIVPTVFSLRRFLIMKGIDYSKGLRALKVTSVRSFIVAG
jgi:hypothetical protein